MVESAYLKWYMAFPQISETKLYSSYGTRQRPGCVVYPLAAFRRAKHWGRASDPNSRFERLTT